MCQRQQGDPVVDVVPAPLHVHVAGLGERDLLDREAGRSLRVLQEEQVAGPLVRRRPHDVAFGQGQTGHGAVPGAGRRVRHRDRVLRAVEQLGEAAVHAVLGHLRIGAFGEVGADHPLQREVVGHRLAGLAALQAGAGRVEVGTPLGGVGLSGHRRLPHTLSAGWVCARASTSAKVGEAAWGSPPARRQARYFAA